MRCSRAKCLRWVAWILWGAAVLTGCGRAPATQAKSGAGDSPGQAAPVPVVVLPAQTMDLQRSVRVVGNLVGLETATLSNRITGVVSKIHVDRGARVKPFEKLLEIEPDRFKLALEESQGALDQTLARLGTRDVPGEQYDINTSAPVRMAKSTLDNAQMKWTASEPLHKQGIMKEFEWEDVDAALNVARSAWESSQNDARALVAQARQNKTQIDMRRKDYQDAVILAPDGTTPEGERIDSYVVTDRKASAGEYLREGTALFTLMADGVLKLQARVPERYLGDVKQNAQVKFHVEAYPKEEFVGIVHTIDPAVDQASRTFMIEALVDNAQYGRRLRPGSFVPGELLTRREAGRVMVPQEAVTSFVGVTKVYKLDGPGKVRAVNVTTGQQEPIKDASGAARNYVEIAQGDIKAGDRVVIEGISKLVDGSAVTVRTAPETAPAAAGGAGK